MEVGCALQCGHNQKKLAAMTIRPKNKLLGNGFLSLRPKSSSVEAAMAAMAALAAMGNDHACQAALLDGPVSREPGEDG
jgi:hypothetical protein